MIPLSDGEEEGAVFHPGESHGARYPLAAVWEEVLAGTFSTIGRMDGLAKCFDSTGTYTRPELPTGADPVELEAAIRAIHVLVWKDWLSGSLERQQTDLLVYASEAFETVEAFLEAWQSARPYLAFPPESATPQEQEVFVSNLEILLGRLRNQYCGRSHELPSPPAASPLVQRVFQKVAVAYVDPDLSLDTLSRTLGISKRHLARKWRECVGQSFSEYLADLRVKKAAVLLRESSFGVKTISVMIGYRDCNYFIREFRKRMNCTPGQFRLTLPIPENSPPRRIRRPIRSMNMSHLCYKCPASAIDLSFQLVIFHLY